MTKYTAVESEEPDPAPEYTALQIEEPATAPPAASDQASTTPLTDAEIYKRLPKKNARGEEVVNWLNLLVQHRTTRLYIPPLDQERDLPFLLRSDLDAMTEEELRWDSARRMA